MCRIVGRVSKVPDDFAAGLKTMMNAVAHGGPDDEGSYVDGGVALGHRRLSIIELSKAGHQPMLNEKQDVIISFNGEIYNYQDLRKELELEGLNFRTKSDTEVIIHAYEFWGTGAFDKLEGIFAFALYDKNQQLVFLVRDHLGVKPLYYFKDSEQLMFASEVRAFKAVKGDWKENEDWKILFLAFGSIPHPYTTLEGVVQLAPGSYLILDLRDFSSSINCYYKFNNLDYSIKSTDEALTMMQFASRKALRKNLISDAPLGIFLSGGIDSSLLTLLADQYVKKVNTISVNFDDASYDEYPFQKLVLDRARNVDHTAHRVTEKMFWEQIDDVWNAMDQPSVDGVNTYFVTRCAKRDGIKVVLSGLGADEVFGGYVSFGRIKWMRRFRLLPFKKTIAALLSRLRDAWGRVIYLTLPGAIGDYLFLRGIFTPTEISSHLGFPVKRVWEALEKIPSDIPPGLKDIEYASQLETRIYMSNQLLKDTDIMGMWHGVEVRVPFLDIEMIKKVHTIKPSVRYNDNWPKYLITASNSNVLPRKIVFRKKMGFTFPFELWMKRSSKKFRSLLPEGLSAANVYRDYENDKCHWSKCWSLAVLQQFR